MIERLGPIEPKRELVEPIRELFGTEIHKEGGEQEARRFKPARKEQKEKTKKSGSQEEFKSAMERLRKKAKRTRELFEKERQMHAEIIRKQQLKQEGRGENIDQII